MANHRRRSRTASAASELSEAELAALVAELQGRLPSTASDLVAAAVRDALMVLSGLDTALHHLSTLVRRRAEATLDESRETPQIRRHSANSGSRAGASL